jgi:FlaA1/EpsC-like NDP-sugar epimerase
MQYKAAFNGRKSISGDLYQHWGTKNLADLSCLYNVKKFVMISTDKAVNLVMLGASKRIAEKYVQSLSLKTDTESVKKLEILFLVMFWGLMGL